MHLVCLDLEGVLTPEIWISVAEKTGIAELRRTTRDEPDYDKLMRYRLEILDRCHITLPMIQEVIGAINPLPGALEFMDWLKSQTRVIILSDTYAEFAKPLMAKLGYPTLFCHTIQSDKTGRITGYKLRQRDQKKKAVESFRSLGFRVISAGDSYNDLSMLMASDYGIFFRPPQSLVDECPEFSVTTDHTQLKSAIEALF